MATAAAAQHSSSSADQSGQQSSASGRPDLIHSNNVRARLDDFVTYFVKEFEAKLHFFHLILEKEAKPKTGKLADTFSGIIGQVAFGAIGVFIGLPVFDKVGYKVGDKGGGKIGRNYYKEKVINLQKLIESSQKDQKANFRRELVKAGFDIFQSFEMQFTRVTTNQSPKDAMHVLAIDATNRAINYFIAKNDDCTAKAIAEGAILGASKSKGILRKIAGN
jgi:hypothetical protein